MLELKTKLPPLYTKIGIIYLILSLVLVASVFYFSLGRLTIFLTSQAERVTSDFIVEVKPIADGIEPAGDVLNGKLFQFELSEIQNFTSSGEQVLESNLVGTVTIVNDYSRDQTLVKTTRLLAPDGTLLRTNEDVIVPSKTTRDVLVYPDIPESFEALGPTKFIIPGLWEGLQEYIYAENSETLRQEGIKVNLVTQSDLDEAREKLSQSLQAKIVSAIDEKLTNEEQLQTKVFTSESLGTSCDADANEAKDEFSCSQTIQVKAVVFDEAKAKQLAKAKLQSGLPGGKVLSSLNAVDLDYDLDRFYIEDNKANIKFKAATRAILSEANELLDRRTVVGGTEKDIRDYFLNFSEISQVRFEYYPSWIRKIPNDSNRISIEIE